MKFTKYVAQFEWMLVALTFTSFPVAAEEFRIISWDSTVELNGSQIPGGDYGVRWKSHKSGATITFLSCEHPIAIAQGKWEKRDSRYKTDSIMYQTREDGTRKLLEVRFAGMKRALVFAPSESEAKNNTNQPVR